MAARKRLCSHAFLAIVRILVHINSSTCCCCCFVVIAALEINVKVHLLSSFAMHCHEYEASLGFFLCAGLLRRRLWPSIWHNCCCLAIVVVLALSYFWYGCCWLHSILFVRRSLDSCHCRCHCLRLPSLLAYSRSIALLSLPWFVIVVNIVLPLALSITHLAAVCYYIYYACRCCCFLCIYILINMH